MYKDIIRPLLFKVDPELIHNRLLSFLKVYRHLHLSRYICSHIFSVESNPFQWKGITFPNRIGLSSGFDKNAQCFDVLTDFGFGFIEVGTITPEVVNGNPKPRIFRLPSDYAFISRTGFNNYGKEVVLENIKRLSQIQVLGININSNHPSNLELCTKELSDLFVTFSPYAKYFTINWGSIDPNILIDVLHSLNKLTERETHPILLKLPADLPLDMLDYIIQVAKETNVDGFIASGPSQQRNLIKITSRDQVEKLGAGGISGHPIFVKSLKLVEELSKKCPENMLIIGAGGVITADDARKMKNAGADLVQIYSALIYEGPAVVKEISKGLI